MEAFYTSILLLSLANDGMSGVDLITHYTSLLAVAPLALMVS